MAPICSRAGQTGPAEAPVTAVVNASDCHGYLEAGSSDSWRTSWRRWPENLPGLGDPGLEKMFCKGLDDPQVRGPFFILLGPRRTEKREGLRLGLVLREWVVR